ncbi:glycosyltransferase [Halomonas mongoliensis]|uniref:glycosyltransferase n=1 Tax=Halomonas mongoliensis TaxID=321265 RepID=UPI00403B04BD
MRVAHIITGIGEGGAQAVLCRLCINDTRNEHTVICMMQEARYGRLLAERGIRVVYLGMPRGKLRIGPLVRLWRLLRRERFDVVQTWMYHADLLGGLVSRLAGVPRICWGIRHSGLVPGESSRSTIAVARLCAMLSPWLPHAIVCCADNAAWMHQKLGYCGHKLHVIPNGYALDDLMPDPEGGGGLRDALGVPRNTVLIGMVGRLNVQKHHENLLDALVKLRSQGEEVRCLLVGEGVRHDMPDVARWLTSRGLENTVNALGTRTDIPAIMNALDLHVLSSAFGEGFPNVVAEAMACGTPCVTTDVGDAARIVGDIGWVVPPRDSEALAAAIGEALRERREQPEAWLARQARAHRHIHAEYGLERMVEAYRQLWRAGTPHDTLEPQTEGAPR